jgi:Raf kinase inhibitor-like YbhB/YbcL family protein
MFARQRGAAMSTFARHARQETLTTIASRLHGGARAFLQPAVVAKFVMPLCRPTWDKEQGMPDKSRQALALQRAGEPARRITVSSPAIHGTISKVQSEYGDGVSPEIWWDRVDGAKTYALILEDPDAHTPTPFVHWVAYNIPPDRTSLPEGLRDAGRPGGDAGFLQGKTSQGNVGYFGPRPPPGDPPHHYHFQVFALDTELDLLPEAEPDQVVQAMTGHVLASGELVGTYQQPAEAARH